MPRYFYKSKNMKGDMETGVLTAADASALAKILRRKGYFLIDFRDQSGPASKKPGWKASINNWFGVPVSEKLFFTDNLEVMIRTGVPLPRAFEILARQTKNKKFKKVLGEISERIVKGESLSESLSFFPKIFSKLYQETIKIGEETGKIEESLKVLAKQMEREYSLKSQIKTAMVYPAVVLVLALIIGIFMFIFAVPRIKEAFSELKINLPFTTQLMLDFSELLMKFWPVFLVAVFAAAFFMVVFSRRKKGSPFFSKIALRIPLISRIVKNINSALTLRTLSSMLSAGVPIVRALDVSAGALNNYYFRKSLKNASRVVEKGKKLSEALQPYETLFPSMVLEMLKVGEETGETSRVLEKLADFYEKEVTAAVQKLSSLIEPFLIILVGAIVGFFAISMMQPMFSIMQGL